MIDLLALSFAVAARGQTFDVYPPGLSQPRAPIVLFVHGGAWIGGNKAQYAGLGRSLASTGFCAAVIDYHLAPKFKHPRPVEDLETARRALIKTAGPRCDPRRVALIGHSAGAHAVAFWASSHTDSVRAMVGLEGIYDVPKLALTWPTYPDWFLNAEFGAPARWPGASPTRQSIKNRAPWLLVHSTADELIDADQTKDFAARLKRQKIEVETFDPATRTHFEVVDDLNDSKSASHKRVIDYLKMKLGI